MSPLPLLVVILGIVRSRVIVIHEDTEKYQPFISRSQETRICTELCASGLGGTPCGAQCTDLVPENLPATLSNSSHFSRPNNMARQEICPILCDNDLGYPLCHCNADSSPTKKIDFESICIGFCDMYNYQVYGCQSCPVYKEQNQKPLSTRRKTPKIDWDLWCKVQCASNNGGAACNCDILPMKLK